MLQSSWNWQMKMDPEWSTMLYRNCKFHTRQLMICWWQNVISLCTGLDVANYMLKIQLGPGLYYLWLTPTFIPLWETTLFLCKKVWSYDITVSLNAHVKLPIMWPRYWLSTGSGPTWFPSNTWGLQNYSNYAVSVTTYNCGYRRGGPQ